MKLKTMLMAVCILTWVFTLFLIQPVFAEVHNIVLVDLSLSTNQTYEGLDVRIEVATRNQGNVPETFNVKLCANGTSELINIDTYQVTSLGALASIVIPFVWNTNEVNPGNYTIWANASIVEGELDIADNIIVGDNITVLGDDTSPVIDVPFHNPRGNIIQEYSMVYVYVNVSDSESGVCSVILSWKVNNASYWYNRIMDYDPSQGYSYNIGTYGGITVISYRIIAMDNAGNQAIRDHAGDYYTYTVIPEFPSTTVPFILLFFTLSMTLILTTKHNLKRVH